MLPVIVLDPIKFNLIQQQRKPVRMANMKNNPRCSRKTLNSNIYSGGGGATGTGGAAAAGGDESILPDNVTLYPITVEFDRLLRRQQQLKRSNQSTNRFSGINFPTGVTTATTGCAPIVNSIPNSKYCISNSTGPIDTNSLLSGLDAKELLYSAVIHYYYAVNYNNGNWMVDRGVENNDDLESMQDESNCCARNNERKETESARGGGQAHACLFQLYQTLCTPGTRTILLLANKNELNSKILQTPNPISATDSLIEEFNNNNNNLNDQSKTTDGAEEQVIEIDEENALSEIGSINNYHNQSKTSKTLLLKDRNLKKFERQDSEATNISEDLQIDSIMVNSIETLSKSHNNNHNPQSDSNNNNHNGGGGQMNIGIVQKIIHLLSSGQSGMMNSSWNSKTLKKRSNFHNVHQKQSSSRGQNVFLHDLDRFLDRALQRKLQYLKQRAHIDLVHHNVQCSIMSSSSTSSCCDCGFCEESDSVRHSQPVPGTWTFSDLQTLIGIEQQLIGSVTYYKSYRLSGIKMIELALIGVRADFQNAGIGSQLIQFVKENGQIGPYDVIRVKISASNNSSCCIQNFSGTKTNNKKQTNNNNNKLLFSTFQSKKMKQFLLRNGFTDDLILNASFEQLDGVCSDGDEDQEDEVNEDQDQDDEEEEFDDSGGHNRVPADVDQNGFHHQHNTGSMLHHSVSMLDNLSYSLNSDHHLNSSPASIPHHRNHRNKPIHTINGPSMSSSSHQHPHYQHSSSAVSSSFSMCYLPPFSVSTLSNRMGNNPTTTSTTSTTMPSTGNHNYHQGQPPPSQGSLLTDMDNRYVDDIIDEANRTWRRDLLAAYRTQWSCVGRLRAEIVQLRALVRQRDSLVEQLRRDNYQLRTTLLQNERTKANQQLNEQRTNLFLLKNLNFDSLNF